MFLPLILGDSEVFLPPIPRFFRNINSQEILFKEVLGLFSSSRCLVLISYFFCLTRTEIPLPGNKVFLRSF